MGKKEKNIAINPQVIAQIQKDLDCDGVRFYELDKVPPVFIDKNLIHRDVLAKCSFVCIAASGCLDEGRNYMFLAGGRVDLTDDSIVTDIDPIVMVADLATGAPASSGCIRFHGDFEGRTESENLNIDATDIAVHELRKNVTCSKQRFKEAPIRFTKAMHYMAKVYRKRLK